MKLTKATVAGGIFVMLATAGILGVSISGYTTKQDGKRAAAEAQQARLADTEKRLEAERKTSSDRYLTVQSQADQVRQLCATVRTSYTAARAKQPVPAFCQ